MGEVKECCKINDNLVVKETRTDLVVYVCKECKKRHFKLTVDPGVVGAKLSK
jgi:hypothetical protein